MNNGKQHGWQAKFCPLLTMGSLKPPQAEAVVKIPGAPPAAPQGEAIGCQGSNCMAFLSSPEADGSMRGDGNCAFTAMAIIWAQMAGATVAVAERAARLAPHAVPPAEG